MALPFCWLPPCHPSFRPVYRQVTPSLRADFRCRLKLALFNEPAVFDSKMRNFVCFDSPNDNRRAVSQHVMRLHYETAALPNSSHLHNDHCVVPTFLAARVTSSLLPCCLFRAALGWPRCKCTFGCKNAGELFAVDPEQEQGSVDAIAIQQCIGCVEDNDFASSRAPRP